MARATDARKALNRSASTPPAVRLWITEHVFTHYGVPFTASFEQFPDRTILVRILYHSATRHMVLLKPIKNTQAFQIYGSEDYFNRTPDWVRKEFPSLIKKFVEDMPNAAKEAEVWDE